MGAKPPARPCWLVGNTLLLTLRLQCQHLFVLEQQHLGKFWNDRQVPCPLLHLPINTDEIL
jgi:hypothetical protein